MAKIVGVRFRKGGKLYYFDPLEIDVKLSDWVIVKTARGQEVGQVVMAPREVPDEELDEPLKPVVRKADTVDIERALELEKKAQESMGVCREMINKLNLQMKLLSAEYNLDGTRLTFLFSAAERVDFRELVRELTAKLKTRVELRQVGPRDEAKLVGGFGRCGRTMCCAGFLNEFAPVSIKMAKEQNLPLNPMKISGVCGRLLCCLTYEHEMYRCMKGKMPKEGQKVTTPLGEATVLSGNPLSETVLVQFEESKAQQEMPLCQVKAIESRKGSQKSAESGQKTADVAQRQANNVKKSAGNNQKPTGNAQKIEENGQNTVEGSQ
ncbi:MAG: stage 0 sporulation family protein [Chloroflexi bacterium]|nr:stage 0 sporulation family protein [Chloroflexota bacterium]